MGKILIVDDDLLNSQIYATKLRAENHEVILCGSGAEALEKITEKYDLIILDIMMPQMDGTQILEELKKGVNKNTVILIYTNLLSDKTKEACLQAGAKEYLIKADFTPSQLLEKIKSYIQ